MKYYTVLFDENEDTGLFGISVVGNPAMESMFLTLKKDEKPLQLAEVDRKEKTLLGVALIPDKPIYRNVEGEEFYITFPKETIKAAAHSFIKNGYQKNSSLEHETKLEGMSVVEAWIVKDPENDTANAYGLPKEDIVEGAFVVKMKCDNEEIYNKALSGEIKGFSIDGLFNLKEINLKSDEMDVTKLGEKIAESFEATLKKYFNPKETEEEKQVKLALSAIEGVENIEALEALKNDYEDGFYEKVKEQYEAKEVELKKVDEDNEVTKLVAELTDNFGKKIEEIKLESQKEKEVLEAEIVKLKSEKEELETKLAAKKIVHAPIENKKRWEEMTPLERYRESKAV